jgi:hypothetical protein
MNQFDASESRNHGQSSDGLRRWARPNDDARIVNAQESENELEYLWRMPFTSRNLQNATDAEAQSRYRRANGGLHFPTSPTCSDRPAPSAATTALKKGPAAAME